MTIDVSGGPLETGKCYTYSEHDTRLQLYCCVLCVCVPPTAPTFASRPLVWIPDPYQVAAKVEY